MARSKTDAAIERLRGGVIEGRFENVRYRQDQFHALHKALRENSDAICEAITQDSKCSTSEAETEFCLAMDTIQQAYNSLNFEKSIEDEYNVTKGKDYQERRVGVGLVAIQPQRHSEFYSILSPIAAAIAAGNSILIEPADAEHPSQLHTLLQTILTPIMDQDTFSIVSSQLPESQIAEVDLFIDQTCSISTSNNIHSTTETRTLAIVDRSASIEAAAKAITSSCLSTESTSPYSPDLVIVNEYIKDMFTSTCLQHASNQSPTTKSQPLTSERKAQQSLIQELSSKGEVKTHTSPHTPLQVIDLLTLSSPLLTTKLTGPYILLIPSTSLIDAITISKTTNQASRDRLTTYLASYLFASPKGAKYLAEQIPSHASYVNQIPAQLLFGPPSPTKHQHALHPRYTPEMFCVPRPQYIIAPSPLPPSSPSSIRELKPTGQKPGHALGFFEQGILLGIGSAALVVLPVLGWGAWNLGSRGWKLVKGR